MAFLGSILGASLIVFEKVWVWKFVYGAILVVFLISAVVSTRALKEQKRLPMFIGIAVEVLCAAEFLIFHILKFAGVMKTYHMGNISIVLIILVVQVKIGAIVVCIVNSIRSARNFEY